MKDTEPMSPETAVMILRGQDSTPRTIAEAVAALAGLVTSVMPSPYQDALDDRGHPRAWHFIGYRPDAAALGKHTTDTLNAPDAPQYQGVVWADGTVTLRWLTARRSTSVWESFAEMFDVHGHPEYGTRIVWIGDPQPEALQIIRAAREAMAERDAEVAEAERAGSVVVETTEPAQRNGETTAVCLDCTVNGSDRLLVLPFLSKAGADDWTVGHLDTGHRTATVPGHPGRATAIATARAHLDAQS